MLGVDRVVVAFGVTFLTVVLVARFVAGADFRTGFLACTIVFPFMYNSIVRQERVSFKAHAAYATIAEHMATKQKTSRTRKSTKKSLDQSYESDSTYLLKLVVFVLLGTLWLKFSQPLIWHGVPINGFPFGLIIGLILVRQFEKHQSDRKIWYASLIVVTIICYFVPAGIVI